MLRIAIAQMEIIPGRPDLNARTVLQMISEARPTAQMIVFPALCLTGSHLGDNLLSNVFLRDCEEYGRRIAAASRDMWVVFGNVAWDQQRRGAANSLRLYDAIYIAHNGELVRGENSPYPFLLRQLDNSGYFTGLNQLSMELGRSPEELLPTFTVTTSDGIVTVGLLVGEVPSQHPAPYRSPNGFHPTGSDQGKSVDQSAGFTAANDAQLLLHIAPFHYSLGHSQIYRQTLAKEAAGRKHPLLFVNNTGIQNNGKTIFIYDGVGTAYSDKGEITHCCPAFTSGLFELSLNSFTEKDSQALSFLNTMNDISYVHKALRYGIKKFLAQIGMERVVIGASGGIDSALAAALYTDALGPEQVLLANLPSVYNSRTTRDLAEELAHNLGCHYTVLPIQDTVDSTIKQITTTPILNCSTGTQSHLTVTPIVAENIQARDRSARLLAGVAAAFGGGFTCNANKSELTIGYSTLYGDLAGFLAAQADLWKYQVYQLADYLNHQVFRGEVIPQKTIDIIPSAELSPAQAVEEGKGDPLHYPYHDYLFQTFVESPDRITPEEILVWYQNSCLEEQIGCSPGLVTQLFPTPVDFISDLERWWNLYTGFAIAKRIQSPPLFAVSSNPLGKLETQKSTYFSARYVAAKEGLLRGQE